MPRRIEELQCAIAEQIEVLAELQPFVSARRQEIIENKRPAAIRIRPVRIADLVLARDKRRVREVSQATRMVQMRMRQNDVLHVFRLIADALDLLVERIL